MSNNNNNGSIENVKDFLEQINDIVKPETKITGKVLFRGQENQNWKIQTSAYVRLFNGEPKGKPASEEQELYYNIRLIQQFKHADFHGSNSSEIIKFDLGILAQLQHNGSATSLIDFSANPLVALWFACKISSKSDSNYSNIGQVFILSTDDESKFEEIDSFEKIEEYKVSIPDELQNTQINGILNNPKFFYWKPAYLNKRIAAQQSYFLIGKRELPEMEKITIPGNSKSKILKELSTVYGINEITLFPDLVGFAQANSIFSPYNQEEQNETQKFIYKTIILRMDKIIKTNIKDAGAYNERGVAKYNLEDHPGAINDFDKAIENNPNYATAYNNRGGAKDSLGDYNVAIDNYNEAIRINPNNGTYYNNLGASKYGLGNDKLRLKDYQKAIDNYQGAVDNYETALKISKNKKLTEVIIKNINRVQKILNNLHNKLSKDKDLTEKIDKALKQTEEKIKELQNKPTEDKK